MLYALTQSLGVINARADSAGGLEFKTLAGQILHYVAYATQSF